MLWFQQITFDTTAVIASFFGVLSAVIAAIALVRSNKSAAQALTRSNEATVKANETATILSGWRELNAALQKQIEMMAAQLTAQETRLAAQDARIIAQDLRINESVAKVADCEQRHSFLEGKLQGMGVIVSQENDA